jgi:lipoprotein-anchoring transpeptidase ErfK/SrfK
MRKNFPLAIFLTLLILALHLPTAQANGPIYTVQPGDSLYSIALQYQVEVDNLAAANGLDQAAWIQPGQQLLIPIPAPTASAPAQPANPTMMPAPLPAAAQPNYQLLPAQPAQLLYPPAPAASQPAYAPNTWTTIDPYAGYQPAPVSGLAPSSGYQPAIYLPANQTPATYAYPLPPNYFSRPYSLPQPNNDLITANGPKWIDINLSTQILTAMEGQTPVYRVLVSTGTATYPTVEGTFQIYAKFEHADMTGGSGIDFYSLTDVPYVMYFHGSYGMHGTYWHNNFGTPMSHGCVNLRTPDAQWLFLWAPVGTKVVTHY